MEAGASKPRRQCLLAWLLAGYFFSQYSQVSSCVFSKNLVLELGLGDCGVPPAAESWRKGQSAGRVGCPSTTHASQRGESPAAWLTAYSLQSVILLRAQSLSFQQQRGSHRHLSPEESQADLG